MIISRAPFRVSFCGGGSDIPSFYEKYGGCVLSCSIKKYIYITLHPSFDKKTITLKYSKTEIVDNYDDIKHKYFKHILKKYNLKGIVISSIADIPSGTGLGSSSAFCVTLLENIKTYLKLSYSAYSLAEEACNFEINEVKSPIGKQDQFASSFGGLNFIKFYKNSKVIVEPIVIPDGKEAELQNNLLLFYTGIARDANKILRAQSKGMKNNKEKIKIQLKLCKMAFQLKKHLENGDIDFLGKLLKKSWYLKKKLCNPISNITIDNLYKKAINAGAIGGKLLGAGGGGFLLFYVKPEKQQNVRKALFNLNEIKFEIDHEGSTIIYGIK